MENIKWIYHRDNFAQSLREYFITNRFSDVKIVCENETFVAHRVVLSAGSDYFKKVFAENSSDSVILMDFPADVIGKLLMYMYAGEIEFPTCMLDVLLKCADQLEIKGICKARNGDLEYAPSRRKQSHPQKCADAIQPLNEQQSILYKALSCDEEPLDLTQNRVMIEYDDIEVDSAIQPKKTSGASEVSTASCSHADLDTSTESMKNLADATRKSKRKIVTAKPTAQAPTVRGRPRNGRRWGESDTMRKAVNDVWQQRLNKSQASKKYKIPYNSLLSYVNGRHKLRYDENMNGREMTLTPPSTSRTPPAQTLTPSPPFPELIEKHSPVPDEGSNQSFQQEEQLLVKAPTPQKVQVQSVQPYHQEPRPFQPYPETMGVQPYPSHMMSWIEHSVYNPHALVYADMIARANLTQYQGHYGN